MGRSLSRGVLEARPTNVARVTSRDFRRRPGVAAVRRDDQLLPTAAHEDEVSSSNCIAYRVLCAVTVST